MHWNELFNNLSKEYPFFEKVQVGTRPDDCSYKAHPLLVISTAFVLKILQSDIQKFALFFPRKENLARWVSIFSALDLMKTDFNNSKGVATEFTPGEKLYIDGCIVEFIKSEFNTEFGQTITIRTRERITYTFPLSRIPTEKVFMNVETGRRLSKYEDVISTINRLTHETALIDNVLGINTYGNKAFFNTNIVLISNLGETEDFLFNNYLNGKQLSEITLSGKINNEGNYKLWYPHVLNAKPSLLVSNDLFDYISYISQSLENSSDLFIDGIKKYSNNMSAFDSILEKNKKVVVICDLTEEGFLEEARLLKDRDFAIWVWNKHNIPKFVQEINSKSGYIFNEIDTSVTNIINFKITQMLCSCSILEWAVKELMSMSKTDESEGDKEIRFLIIRLTNYLSRMVTSQNHERIKYFRNLLVEYKRKVEKSRQWYSENSYQTLLRVISILLSFAENKCDPKKHKNRVMRDYIINELKNSSNTFAVVVQDDDELQKYVRYWKAVLNIEEYKRLLFYNYKDFVNDANSSTVTQVLICGWLGGKKIYNIIYSNKHSKYVLFGYKFELDWFNKVSRTWELKRNNVHNSGSLIELLGYKDITEPFYNNLRDEDKTKDNESYSDYSEFDPPVPDIDYAVYAYSDNPEEEKVNATLVVFGDGRFSFFTDTHGIYTIDNFSSKTPTLPVKHVADLCEGDYILFKDSNRDLIRDKADQILIGRNKNNLRKKAGLWKEYLRQAYEDYDRDLNKLINKLKSAGCERNDATVRYWIFDDNTIGPANEDDVDAVFRALNITTTPNETKEIKYAISEVRSAHLQASSHLYRYLVDKLPDVLSKEKGLPEELRDDSITHEIEGFGQIQILKVREVSEQPVQVAVSKANRLLRKDLELWQE